MTVRRLLPLLALGLTAACGPVNHTMLRQDYAQVDRQQTKRLLLVTSPDPEGQPKLGALWSLLARRWVNHHRNFLVKEARPPPPVPQQGLELKSLCGEGLEGVLGLQPEVHPEGKLKVHAAVKATLIRCRDGEAVWSTDASGTWMIRDPELTELVTQYKQELGPEVGPYVVPSFQLLKATLSTLPDPQLTDEDVNEKIELEE